MNIALDYDGTITADIDAWKSFCQLFRSRGHKVYIVTMRYPQEVDATVIYMQQWVDDVIFTSRKAKQPFIQQYYPQVTFDVWIDDHPKAILYDAEIAFGNSTPLGVVADSSGNLANITITGVDKITFEDVNELEQEALGLNISMDNVATEN